jgi:hypothetical protein
MYLLRRYGWDWISLKSTVARGVECEWCSHPVGGNIAVDAIDTYYDQYSVPIEVESH